MEPTTKLKSYVYIILFNFSNKQESLVHYIVEFTLVSDNVRVSIQSSIKGFMFKGGFGF